MMRVLDLFSGIGGFSLGLERTGGFETVAFCEIEEYPRRVLARHWPGVPIYPDVRELTADTLARDGIAVDVICGGFPCQDISFAGRRAGLEGERSGLWREYARLIREIRPRFVIIENVPGLLSGGSAVDLGDGSGRSYFASWFGVLLGDLAALGYDATWDCIPAAAVGAPHRRDRVWIIAHANGHGQHDGAIDAEVGRTQEPVADADRIRQSTKRHGKIDGSPDSDGQANRVGGDCENASHSDIARLAEWQSVGSDDGEERATTVGADWWLAEPDVGRVAHGVPARVDRLRSLGNAVVPQIPELIGRAILQAEGVTP